MEGFDFLVSKSCYQFDNLEKLILAHLSYSNKNENSRMQRWNLQENSVFGVCEVPEIERTPASFESFVENGASVCLAIINQARLKPKERFIDSSNRRSFKPPILLLC